MVEGLPLPPELPLVEPTLHSSYFTLTASVYMTPFTLASGSRVTREKGSLFMRDKVTPGGETTFHSSYFTLTASVYMTQFTLASGSRVTQEKGSLFMRDKVTPGGETTFSHVSTLTRLPQPTPWERFNMIG